MTRYQPHNFEIPVETIEVAQAAFPKGNVYLTLRDKLGPLFTDEAFAPLFSWQGQAGVSPGMLAMVTIMQFMEGLTDRQGAEAVRSRIDWKYALGLPLKHSGFDHSILSGFRERLLSGQQEALLFDQVLDKFKAHGLLTGKSQQRTDSTHVVAAIRSVNRLECVGETLRRLLDDLARVAPEWLLSQISLDWFDRYGTRLEAYRLPDKKSERAALQQQIGQDGSRLLTAIYSADAPLWLRELPAVDVMLRVWRQQYYFENEQIHWRDDKSLPPFKLLIISPDDIEARNRTKRETNWSGYAAHLTETCQAAEPNVITNVLTTPATTADVEVTPTIHQALADKELLPEEHFVDTAYTSVDNLLAATDPYQIDLIGPVAGGGSWQAKAGKGFDVSCFQVDWAQQVVTCPQGKTSQTWHPRQEKYGHQYFEIRFAPADCHPCPCRADCTKSKRGVRVISLRPQAEYETLKRARERQQTEEFKTKYKKRAGIEGTISQGTRAFELRRTRYLGLAKTHLQHLATAAAINLTRIATWWLAGEPQPQPYRSPFAKLKPACLT
jgi:transposase